jgi:hypothetical protein
VVLDPLLFPEEIYDEFNNIKQNEIDKSKVNYSQINMHNLLEGTRYVQERKTENVSSIFKDLDKIKGASLF